MIKKESFDAAKNKERISKTNNAISMRYPVTIWDAKGPDILPNKKWAVAFLFARTNYSNSMPYSYTGGVNLHPTETGAPVLRLRAKLERLNRYDALKDATDLLDHYCAINNLDPNPGELTAALTKGETLAN